MDQSCLAQILGFTTRVSTHKHTQTHTNSTFTHTQLANKICVQAILKRQQDPELKKAKRWLSCPERELEQAESLWMWWTLFGFFSYRGVRPTKQKPHENQTES